MIDTIKDEIVEVSTLLSEKILKREISAEDHQTLIDDFINGIGENNEEVNNNCQYHICSISKRTFWCT